MQRKVFIIAEAGVNHNGSLDRAKTMIRIASEAGADAVKFQTFKTEAEISKFARKAKYQLQNTNIDESQFDMVKKLELDSLQHEQLVACCKKYNIEFLSTPFDMDSIDLLVKHCHVSQFKISSGEITSGPLLLKAAKTNLPIILSTGMATLSEIEQALGVLAFGYLNSSDGLSGYTFKKMYCSKEGQAILRKKVTLLHCTTEYPAPFSSVNLRVLDTLKAAFGLPIGYSDHTQGICVPIAAVARGACVIEKHFTLDKNLPGPDHQASLEPEELKDMVDSIRQIELSLGNGIKIPDTAELKNMPIARKSLVADRGIKKGEVFTEKNLTFKRPGNGICPMYYWDMLGRKAKRNYGEDEVIDHADHC